MNEKNNYIIIAGTLLIFLSCGFFVYNAFFYKNEIPKETDNIIKDFKNEVTETTTDEGLKTTIKFKNYEVTIPDEYIYHINDNSIGLEPSNELWYGSLGFSSGSYNKLKENKDTAKKYFEDAKYSVGKYGIYRNDNREWLTFELTSGTTHYIAGYTKLNSIDVIVFIVRSIDNDYNYKYLEDIEDIIKSIN